MGVGRRMQVVMRPSNFNAVSRWFRVSSIRLLRHTKSLDNFAEAAEPTCVTVTQEVPVSRAFEAYPAKPPQAHERILNRLFLLMKTTARITLLPRSLNPRKPHDMVRAQMAGFVFYAFYAHKENTYKYSHFQQKKPTTTLLAVMR